MMMKRFSGITLIFVTLVLFCSSCGGDSTEDKWKYLGTIKGQEGQKVYVYMDMSNIEINDTKRKFWIRYMDTKGDDSDEQYVRQIGYWEIDCFDKSLFRLGEEYYGPNNQLLGRSEERVREEYSSYESLGAKMSDAACRYAGR